MKKNVPTAGEKNRTFEEYIPLYIVRLNRVEYTILGKFKSKYLIKEKKRPPIKSKKKIELQKNS